MLDERKKLSFPPFINPIQRRVLLMKEVFLFGQDGLFAREELHLFFVGFFFVEDVVGQGLVERIVVVFPDFVFTAHLFLVALDFLGVGQDPVAGNDFLEGRLFLGIVMLQGRVVVDTVPSSFGERTDRASGWRKGGISYRDGEDGGTIHRRRLSRRGHRST